jgi:penicillin-binding protein 1C
MKKGKIKLPVILLLVILPPALFLGFHALFGDILRGVEFSTVYSDREGTPLRVFLAPDEKYRIRSTLSEFSPELVEAVLLEEDQYFYRHWGINPGAMFRAFWETYVKKSRRMGASTITMQLARLRYRLYTRNPAGKIIQILHALFLEICFSKDEILEAYLNLVPLGGNLEGYASGALFYFNKAPRDLTLSEILALAVIPQNPADRAPGQSQSQVLPSSLFAARKALFAAWLGRHPEAARYEAEINLPPYITASFPVKIPHLGDYLNTRAFAGDRRRTTIDSGYQELCERALESFLLRNSTWGIKNGSVLLLDYTTMEVLAALGSASYFDSDIQGQVRGFASKRSPGSTLKPFIYALALEQGLIHPEKMLKDTPASFSEYTPDNYQSSFKGPVHAWAALVESRNIPAVSLAGSIQNPDLYDFLVNAGVEGLREKEHYGLSAVLGSADLTMLELVSLYAALANGGVQKQLRFLRQPDHAADGAAKQLLSPAAAEITLRMLERNPAPGGLRPGGPGEPGAEETVPVAYKTGTSIGFKDAWSIAVFDRFVLAVWVGNFSGEGNNAFIGRLTATPLQFNIIEAILASIPPARRQPRRSMPKTVSTVEVCAISGDIPGDDCPLLIPTWFIPGVSPINRCRIHRRIYIDTRTGYRSDDAESPHIRSEVREFWPSDLLEIFAQAGLPRFTPPPYPPDTQSSPRYGFPPVIISPLSNVSYLVDERHNELVLLASADQDADDLYWFANTLFLGRAKPYERFVWAPDPGIWDLSVVDSSGRSAGLRITVARQPPK